jgi:hypothetical protein
MKKLLFVYACPQGSSISAKCRKIEESFLAAGCDLDVMRLVVEGGKPWRILQLLLFWVDFVRRVSARGYDIIFVRHDYSFLPLYIYCLIIGRRIQLEINSKVKEELLSKGEAVRAMFSDLCLHLAVKCSGRVHAVTQELVTYYGGVYSNAKVVYNPNFVVDEYFIEKRRLNGDSKIRLVFMGNCAQKWHGLELFIENGIAKNNWFCGHCELNIVGKFSDEIGSLIKRYRLEGVVVYHDYLTGEAKARMMDQMRIGIAGFNLSVKGLVEATPIKVGEYLFAGLPVIVGYTDTRLLPDLPYVLQINVNEEVSDLQGRLNRFISGVADMPEVGTLAHQYALDNLMVGKYVERILS